jgi:OHCU decarboxylase
VNLEVINAWTDDETRESFERCCGSRRWSEAMARSRPFESEAAVIATAERIWWGLSEADWLEAFAAHPRIGDVDAIRARFATAAAWASREQAGALAASEDVLRNLATGNRHYEERFGFIFIVCATGKTAEEMLELLKERLSNDPEAELKLAAGEQMKITRIRLERIAPL